MIDRLSADLHAAFPEMKGFSPRNLKYMRAFAEAWPDEEIVQQAVARLPWGHNVRLLDRIESRNERLWYARQAIEHGWSRAVLEAQIETPSWLLARSARSRGRRRYLCARSRSRPGAPRRPGGRASPALDAARRDRLAPTPTHRAARSVTRPRVTRFARTPRSLGPSAPDWPRVRSLNRRCVNTLSVSTCALQLCPRPWPRATRGRLRPSLLAGPRPAPSSRRSCGLHRRLLPPQPTRNCARNEYFATTGTKGRRGRSRCIRMIVP